MDLGRTLKVARKKLGYTQAQLAKGLCDRTTISRIESGALVPPLDLIEELCRRLSIPVPSTHGRVTELHAQPWTMAHFKDLVASRQYDAAFHVGETLFWSFNDFGAQKAMKEIADMVCDLPTSGAMDVLLVPLLFQFIAAGDMANAFDIGFKLIRVQGLAGHHDAVVATTRGLIALHPEPKTRSALMTRIGTATRRLGRINEAISYYEYGQSLAEEHHQRHELARSLHGLSACHLERCQYLQGYQAASNATHLYHDDEDLLWLAMQNRAIALVGLNEVGRGADLLERCASHWEAANDQAALQSVYEDMRTLTPRPKNERDVRLDWERNS